MFAWLCFWAAHSVSYGVLQIDGLSLPVGHIISFEGLKMSLFKKTGPKLNRKEGILHLLMRIFFSETQFQVHVFMCTPCHNI